MRFAATILCAGLAAVALVAASARASDERPSGPSPSRPSFAALRFEEDWSALADPEALPSRDVFDPLKYVPLDEDGSVWLSLGAQARGRVEAWSGFDLGARSDPDAAFFLTRLLAHADLHLHPAVRAFVQGRVSLSTEPDVFDGSRKLDTDYGALQNAFLELSGEPWELPVRVRLGRQELLLGAQRLVSPLDWSNTRRTFDVGSATLELGGWRVRGFGGRPVRVRRERTNDHPPGSAFYGLHAEGLLPGAGGVDLELYGFGRHRDDLAIEGTRGDERRATLGGRVSGRVGDAGIDFDVEGAWQGGSIGSHEIDAFMVATEVGWWYARSRYSPRVYAGFDYASGDGSPGGDLGLFDQLFPLGHAYLGYADVVGRQNLIASSAGVTFRPLPRTTAEITGYGFWRADRSSALYDPGGRLVRAGSLGGSREVGAEIDVLVKHWLDPHALVAVGYSHFFPGRFVEQSGPAASIDFGYVVLQYTF